LRAGLAPATAAAFFVASYDDSVPAYIAQFMPCCCRPLVKCMYKCL
jgi:hypothetical protein